MGVSGDLAVACWTAKWEVKIPARAEIWIEISAPCASLFRLCDHKSVDTRASPSLGLA